MTLFASLTQDLLHERRLLPADQPKGRMVAIVGDAELDEGNVFEALLEGWKHDVRNVWWVIDYNRQSLDRVVPERLFSQDRGVLRRGRLAGGHAQVRQAARRRRSRGPAARRCASGSTTARTTSTRRSPSRAAPPGAQHLERDLGHLAGIRALLDEHDDDALARLMTNLGGHDLEPVLEAFQAVATTTGRTASSPTRSRASACRSPATRTTTPG